ncbi:hypothetical protein BDM02DRAFT_3186910 [Thelephora ganbajun]|uniref:Uncharacterized protein n=1 Tax=Thelephora ganbajun TaxID=370292 RepID=A0ACB6ZGH0_THEGA|nr:hypothetical protein BDM02DRAFT_3186910 [Thelephora ganbajun]
MSFTATPLDQNRRVDRNTFFNKQAQNQQARLVPASYSFGAPSVETRSPPKVIPHDLEDPEEPALVRFAKRKQQSAAQNIDPQRWSVKDTSVQIANAFHQAATSENPMPPPVPINPNDSWATGTARRTNLPRSTSVEYEKETQSTATRRLNPPPANRLPPRRPISKTGSTNLVPDSEEESPTYTRGKSPFEHVAGQVLSLVKPVVSIHMKPRSPEREQSMASYDYASEEREYRNDPAAYQQSQKKAPASKRNRISSDNKAYKPTASDLEESDEDFIDSDRKRRRKKKRNDSVGGPLTSLPVAGYDKKRRRKKNAKGEYVEEEEEDSETDEQSKVSEHRAASIVRNSVPPPNRLSRPPEPPSYSEPSLEMAESGLASIPEIEEPLETDVEPDLPYPETSDPSFSIGGFLGKLVNIILRSIMGTISSIFSVLGYISWASMQMLRIVFDGPRNLWKNNSGALVSFVVLILAVYVLRQGGITVSWITPSKPVDYAPPGTPAADVSELSARLQALERALYDFGADSRHSQRRVENDLTKSVSDFLDKLSALDRRLTVDVSKISEADNQNRQMTNKGINAIKKSVEDLRKKIQDGTLPGQKGGKDDGASKELEKLLERQREELKAKWKVLEERIGTVEGDVKEALELGKSVSKTGAGNAPAWWNKIASKPLSTVTIKSTDGQDVTSLIHQMVDSITSNWSKDILARPDFALHSAGAQVIPSLTSATYSISPESVVGKTVGFVTGSGYASGLSPINALHPHVYAGRCWPFKGSEGQLGVKLAWRAHISDITIDHVAKEVAFDLRSTPRQMEVWGLVEGQDNLAKVAGWLADRQRRRSDAVESGHPMDLKDEEWEVPKHLPKDAQYIRIAKFLYDAHSTRNIQTFPVDSEVRALGADFGVVVLVVKNNWGRPEYTCLYRFRVHGDMVGEIPPLYEPPAEEQTSEQP